MTNATFPAWNDFKLHMGRGRHQAFKLYSPWDLYSCCLPLISFHVGSQSCWEVAFDNVVGCENFIHEHVNIFPRPCLAMASPCQHRCIQHPRQVQHTWIMTCIHILAILVVFLLHDVLFDRVHATNIAGWSFINIFKHRFHPLILSHPFFWWPLHMLLHLLLLLVLSNIHLRLLWVMISWNCRVYSPKVGQIDSCHEHPGTLDMIPATWLALRIRTWQVPRYQPVCLWYHYTPSLPSQHHPWHRAGLWWVSTTSRSTSCGSHQRHCKSHGRSCRSCDESRCTCPCNFSHCDAPWTGWNHKQKGCACQLQSNADDVWVVHLHTATRLSLLFLFFMPLYSKFTEFWKQYLGDNYSCPHLIVLMRNSLKQKCSD